MTPPPRVLPVGGELAPLDEGQGATPDVQMLTPAGRGRPKEKTRSTKGKAASRFRQLNDFVDVTLRELTHAERSVWLVLFRDTRDGTARTAHTDIARRTGMS